MTWAPGSSVPFRLNPVYFILVTTGYGGNTSLNLETASQQT